MNQVVYLLFEPFNGCKVQAHAISADSRSAELLLFFAMVIVYLNNAAIERAAAGSSRQRKTALRQSLRRLYRARATVRRGDAQCTTPPWQVVLKAAIGLHKAKLLSHKAVKTAAVGRIFWTVARINHFASRRTSGGQRLCKDTEVQNTLRHVCSWWK